MNLCRLLMKLILLPLCTLLTASCVQKSFEVTPTQKGESEIVRTSHPCTTRSIPIAKEVSDVVDQTNRKSLIVKASKNLTNPIRRRVLDLIIGRGGRSEL